MSPRLTARELQELDDDYECIRCGCTDSQACCGGCSWAATNDAAKLGICTSCMGGETLEQLEQALAAEAKR